MGDHIINSEQSAVFELVAKKGEEKQGAAIDKGYGATGVRRDWRYRWKVNGEKNKGESGHT